MIFFANSKKRGLVNSAIMTGLAALLYGVADRTITKTVSDAYGTEIGPYYQSMTFRNQNFSIVPNKGKQRSKIIAYTELFNITAIGQMHHLNFMTPHRTQVDTLALER